MEQCSGDRECQLFAVTFHVYGKYPVGIVKEGSTTAIMAVEEGGGGGGERERERERESSQFISYSVCVTRVDCISAMLFS